MNDLLNVFKALSDETRLRIIKLLEQGELCVCDIVAALDLIQPKVSFHLNALRDAGLVRSRKEGKWIHYRFDDSDTFRRFLILAVLERVSENITTNDQPRLKKWLQQKKLKLEKACCSTPVKKKSGKQSQI